MLVADRNVVSDVHLRVMRAVGEVERAYGDVALRLEGGTALAAYHLHHRESEDLDFFAGREIDVRDWLDSFIPHLTDADLSGRPHGESIPSLATLIVADSKSPEKNVVKVQFARTSGFTLAPLEKASEGIRVASRRDLFRGKMEAICDRTALRDFIDLHQILWRPGENGSDVDEALVRVRFRDLIEDLFEYDPGLHTPYVAQRLAQARERMPPVSSFPLRLLKPVTDAEIRNTVGLCIDESAQMIADGIMGSLGG